MRMVNDNMEKRKIIDIPPGGLFLGRSESGSPIYLLRIDRIDINVSVHCVNLTNGFLTSYHKDVEFDYYPNAEVHY